MMSTLKFSGLLHLVVGELAADLVAGKGFLQILLEHPPKPFKADRTIIEVEPEIRWRYLKSNP